MRKKKDFKADEQFDRSKTESMEGHESVKTDAPSDRFQTDQQVVPASAAMDASAGSGGYSRKKTTLSGSKLKQDVAAKVVMGATGGEVPSGAAGFKSASYSGDTAANVVGDASGTPMVGRNDRSGSRLGKRFDSTAKHIDQIPSENILIEFEESKPLAAEQGVQGYNGTYHTESARAQKSSGKVPADLTFVRSLDELKRDHLYYSMGQVVRASGTKWHDTPDTTMVKQENGEYQPVEGSYDIHRGNYLNSAMNVKISEDGYVSEVSFETYDLSTDEVDPAVANASSVNGVIDMNCAEIDRQNMDSKAGDEKADVWTPLARAVANPSQTVAYLRDLEAMTGSEIFMAYKKTTHCMSYQLNRAAKDGIKRVSPGLEMAIGLLYPEESSLTYADRGLSDAFTADEYVKGASSLQIAINDSVNKYTSKAKLLTMPLAYRHALQTADNNMDVLRLKPEFAAIVNAEEVFSTINRDYDPLLPVCISDKAGIIHPYDFNDLYAFTATSASEKKFVKDPYKYGYSDIRNRYIVTAAFPLIEGLVEYLNDNASKIYSLCSAKASGGAVTISIPMVHSTCHFSLWSLLLLEAMPYILAKRVNSMRDVLYYEKNVEYPFSQLRSIKELNPVNAMNYGYNSYDEPLKVGRMLPSAAIKWVMPELFVPIDEEASDNTFKYILPWYFNQEAYDFSDGTIAGRKDLGAVMSFPSFRSGIKSEFADMFYSMTERDVRLCLDRLVEPIYKGVAGRKASVYKYGMTTDGIPTVTLPGSVFSVQSFLRAPRELGWFIVAPNEVVSKSPGEWTDISTRPCYGLTSYRAKYWFGRALSTAINVSPLQATQVNIERASSFKQDWACINAIGRVADLTENDPGYVLSIAELFTYRDDGEATLIDGKSRFIPFSDGAPTEAAIKDEAYALFTMQKAIWTRLQVLPFLVSPFDVRGLGSGAGEDGIKFDPYDFMYWFNCAGFRASDYNEDVYNRISQRNNQGWLFIEDPFMNGSPLFKDAVKYTSV